MRLRRSVASGPGLHRVRRSRGFSYHDSDGKAITDEATLARLKDLVIPPVKDLRWHGTVLAAVAFVDADPPANKTVIKRVESAVMKEVAEELGNTSAVARG